jgi:hypothetical protein
MPNNRIKSGVISDTPPTPVIPTSAPTQNPKSEKYGSIEWTKSIMGFPENAFLPSAVSDRISSPCRRAVQALTARRLETLRSIEAMRSELMDNRIAAQLPFVARFRLEVEDSLSHMRGDQVDLTHKLEKTRAQNGPTLAAR